MLATKKSIRILFTEQILPAHFAPFHGAEK